MLVMNKDGDIFEERRKAKDKKDEKNTNNIKDKRKKDINKKVKK